MITKTLLMPAVRCRCRATHRHRVLYLPAASLPVQAGWAARGRSAGRLRGAGRWRPLAGDGRVHLGCQLASVCMCSNAGVKRR